MPTIELKVLSFRKKPVSVKAVQFDGTNGVEIQNWILANQGKAWQGRGFGVPYVIISTLRGKQDAYVGDWIIQEIAGEFYPCKPEIFEKTYEAQSAGEEE